MHIATFLKELYCTFSKYLSVLKVYIFLTFFKKGFVLKLFRLFFFNNLYIFCELYFYYLYFFHLSIYNACKREILCKVICKTCILLYCRCQCNKNLYLSNFTLEFRVLFVFVFTLLNIRDKRGDILSSPTQSQDKIFYSIG